MNNRSNWVCRRHVDMMFPSARWGAAAAVASTVAFAPAVEAYVGPGAGMGLLGVMLAVVAAIFMALVGMVLWPIRMVAHRRKAKAQSRDEQRAAEPRRQPR